MKIYSVNKQCKQNQGSRELLLRGFQFLISLSKMGN